MKLTLNKIYYFLRAVFSLRKGINCLEVYWQRENACLGIESGEICPALDTSNNKNLWCTECGCPKWPHADVRLKWLMPKSECPWNKWKDNEQQTTSN